MNASQEIKMPFLVTAQTGPLQLLEQTILDHQSQIEAWFREKWQETPAPVYGSVDLRNAGFKLAPVDMNLYPAGFNNLNQDLWPLASQAARMVVENGFAKCKKILIVPESHTRNLMYWENVLVLQNIIKNAGFDVRIGGMIDEITTDLTLDLPSGKKILIEKLQRTENKIHVADFYPCMVWLNNDLSGGEPDILKGIDQTICPPANLGWHKRLKSVHFNHYQQVAEEFSKIIDIDPWLIDPLFHYCGQVDFKKREGEECLAFNVEKLLAQIQKKYKAYNIPHEPFVIVKADAGTYGMGVMMVKSADEVLALNRKQRNKMSSGKGTNSVRRVIMQEGVYTFENYGAENASAEPVVYMIGQNVVGGFYRLHKGRSNQESLNAPGMHFEPLQFAHSCSAPDSDLPPDDCPNRFYAYGVVARLSMLAAAREQREQSS
jgi:glutamate--cysteine ligase